MMPFTLHDIQRALAAYEPRIVRGSTKRHGAVAMILHESDGGLRMLFIERAERQGDRWSGHAAFPGGSIEPEDADARAAAERETMEEIGLDLLTARYLGQLDDLTAALLPVLVSGFVYAVEDPGPLLPNEEIRDVFWVELDHLIDDANRAEHRFSYDGRERAHPALGLPGEGRPLLWGLTYRFVAQLLRMLGHELPVNASGQQYE